MKRIIGSLLLVPLALVAGAGWAGPGRRAR